MNSQLAYKELRESAGIGLLGAVALSSVAVGNMGLSPLPGLIGPLRYGEIPFLDNSFLYQFGFASCALAIALGLKQSIGDLFGEAQLFVLHRPVPRARIYGMKLVVGLAIHLVLSGMTVLVYAVWAASPGTHASPFDWRMTLTAWTLLFATSTVYLASFLSGIRPAAWIGTRLCPLAASVLVVMLALFLPTWISWLGLIAINALLIALILNVVEYREFA
jgi:hypothetical protein